MGDTSLIAGPRMSAEDARRVMFQSARLGGLNAEAVYDFRDKVVRELGLLAREQGALLSEIDQLRDTIGQLQAQQAEGARAGGLPPVEVQGVTILRRAQENAERLVADAQQQARQMVGDGRQQREHLLADGHAKARQVIASAIEEAGREAARVAAEAPVNAQRQLAYMQSLADSVRAGLTAQLSSLQAQVAEWENSERSGMPAAPRLA